MILQQEQKLHARCHGNCCHTLEAEALVINTVQEKVMLLAKSRSSITPSWFMLYALLAQSVF